MTARHIAVGVEGGALAAELDGRQFAAALESYAHGDEQARLPTQCAAGPRMPARHEQARMGARLCSSLTGLACMCMALSGRARLCSALEGLCCLNKCAALLGICAFNMTGFVNISW